MGFFRDISPRRAMRDLRDSVLRPDQPYRWRFVVAALLPPAAILSLMFAQGATGLPPRPEVLYFESWELGRSDAEIIAGNIEAQKRKEAAQALQAKRDQLRRDAYKAFGGALGMDVDRIEREALADEARAKADRKRRLDEWMNGGKKAAAE